MMEPICLNTPASLLLKKNKFNAIVKGITIPLESLSLISKPSQPEIDSTSDAGTKENPTIVSKKIKGRKSSAKHSDVKIGKKAMSKLR